MLNNVGENRAEILVVDDTPANLQVMAEVLTAAGYTVAAVTSGKRALSRLQTYVPDLILLDIQMPEIDGFEVCRQIKGNPDTASVPIIFITALSDIESITKGFSLGAVDYINKPFQELELLARVKTHVELQTFAQQLEEKVAARTAELQVAVEELQQSKLTLIQHEKMSALGNLVAGVAHEINNPIGFLKGSIRNMQDYVSDLFAHLETYQRHHPPTGPVQESAEDIDLAFLLEDLPKLLTSMQGATERITDISTSLRKFSRADTDYKVSANLHEGLDSTLLILKYRLKANEHRPAIEVIRQYGDLPDIDCFPGQLNQVFMNILANAIDIFDEAADRVAGSDLKDNSPNIVVKTALTADFSAVEVRIRDNGKGMKQVVKAKIFDHLFTTKGVGKGTGLGLAIAQQIVVEAHGGKLEVRSELGQGTEFCIQLPL